jgi:hypothetical protein
LTEYKITLDGLGVFIEETILSLTECIKLSASL